MTNTDRMHFAVHEAGHATLARFFGVTVSECTLQHVLYKNFYAKHREDQHLAYGLIIGAGGGAALDLLCPGADRADAIDIQQNLAALKAMKFSKRVRAPILLAVEADARQLVRKLQIEIIAVADALFQHGELTQSQIDAAMARAQGM